MFRIICVFVVIFCGVGATIYPPPTSCKCSTCNGALVWVLEDCECRPIQNKCLYDYENALRLSRGQKPLVPVTKDLCSHYISKKCYGCGCSVFVAQFPKKLPCGGCGSETLKFNNICELRKYSAEKSRPYISYTLKQK